MSTTIRDLSANNSIVGYLLRTQSDMYKTQIQMATGKISQDYIGISSSSNNLINTETTKAALEQFEKNNSLHSLRLSASEESISIIDKTIGDFRSTLYDFSQTNAQDPQAVEEFQDEAFKTMQVLESFINTEADERYIYSGGKVRTKPVDFGLTTLADFQAKYDGIGVTAATTRDANLTDLSLSQSVTGATSWLAFDDTTNRITSVGSDFNNLSVGSTITVSGAATAANDGNYTVTAIDAAGQWIEVNTEKLAADDAASATAVLTSSDGTVLSLANGDFVDLSFVLAAGTIAVDAATAAGGDVLLPSLAVGSTFTVTGGTANDGTYTVASNDGDTITILEKRMTTDAGPDVGTIESVSYYKGDELTYGHRASKSRTLEQTTNAADPAFEKAFRAMFIIMQGVVGTEGGIDNNMTRADDALYLMDSALGKQTSAAPPYGTEQTSSLEFIQRNLIFQRLVMDRTSENNKTIIGYLAAAEERVENIDKTEVISRLLNYTSAMEASYQAFSRVRSLSLSNFL